MAIRTIVTRGYGNGTFLGTIPLVATRGYTPGAPAVIFVLNFIPIRALADVIVKFFSDVTIPNSSDVGT